MHKALRLALLSGVSMVLVGGFSCPFAVVDYSPSAIITGSTRNAAGGLLGGVSVEVIWDKQRPEPSVVTSSETGTYEVELRRGVGPKVEEIGDVLVVCRPPLGMGLLAGSVRVERVVLRADRDVRRTADCTLAASS